MKYTVFPLGIILFVFSSCASSSSGLSKSSSTPPENSYSEFFGLVDYDNMHTDGSYNQADYSRNGKTYTYTAEDISGNALASKISLLSKGDTLILDGSKGVFNLKTTKFSKSNITIKGINNAVLDFSSTSTYSKKQIDAAIEGVRAQSKAGNGHYLKTYNSEMAKNLGNGYGLYMTGNHNIIQDIVIQNASDNGLIIATGGNYNIIRNVEARFCGDAGIQLNGSSTAPVDCPEEYTKDGPHHNKFFDCYSHNNCDSWNLGENADGFAVKAGAGDFNYFENCRAEYNSDDGWDCYRVRGSVTWVNCEANYNGLCQTTGDNWAEYSNGNGFKVGGGATKGKFNGKIINSPSLHRHAQYLKGCSATGNRGNSGVGFDRNNQHGSVYLVDCFATDNHATLLRDNSSSYRHDDYAFGSYGNKCYVLRCFTGLSSDTVNGNYEGDKISVK
ncbi:hypothetical protein [Treponema sp.]|uniref:hypothetical protein n=1 Tax=Treponema sp. TaxID=166 RepID=UPI00389049B6